MQKIKKYLKEGAWAIYLGGSLSLLNIHFFNWQWWAILLPTLILNEFLNNNNK
jgi:hypothetical protein